MSDQILSSIYSFSHKFKDPASKLTFDLKNKNITAIVQNGNVNVTLQISGKNNDECHKRKNKKLNEFNKKIATYEYSNSQDKNINSAKKFLNDGSHENADGTISRGKTFHCSESLSCDGYLY